jgi:lipoic acid synthetase
MNPKMFIKTGIMVGLGEDSREVCEIMEDAVNAGVDIFTVGQYLRPSPKHAEIVKYYHPDEFVRFREFGERLGLRWVFAGPLVRSSYHAEDVFSHATALK